MAICLFFFAVFLKVAKNAVEFFASLMPPVGNKRISYIAKLSLTFSPALHGFFLGRWPRSLRRLPKPHVSRRVHLSYNHH
jgi:hypothetical protein